MIGTVLTIAGILLFLGTVVYFLSGLFGPRVVDVIPEHVEVPEEFLIVQCAQ